MKRKLKGILYMGLWTLVGFGGGILGAKGLERIGFEWSLGNVVILIFLVGAAYYGQIILHEGGHLAFGLLTGYRFSSFRIGELMLVRKREGFRLKRLSLAGTGGQCLLLPPAFRADFPVVLYNLGGSLMNVLAGAVSLGFFTAVDGAFGRSFLVCMGFFGFLFGILNGIPLNLGGMDNDGRNLRELLKDPGKKRAFWAQLQIVGEMALGKRLREMPEEWFLQEEGRETDGSLSAAVAVLGFSRLMDEGRLDEAGRFGERLFSGIGAAGTLQKYALQGEMLYLELIGERRKEQVERWRSADFLVYQSRMKGQPSVLRQRYAYAILEERDEKEGEKLLEQFEKVGRRYPYEGDFQSERELLERVKKAYERGEEG